MDLATTNLVASWGTLLLLVLNLELIVALVAPSLVPHWKKDFLAEYGLWIGFALTAVATVITLYYSEVLGVAPCSWCWVQRVFLYPQVVIFLIAAIVKDNRAMLYSIVLSGLGGIVALYHHYLQMGGSLHLPCPADGNAIDCATPTFLTWGFVTFPFMSLMLFLFLVLFMTYLRSIAQKYQPEGRG